jgi:hypothetical protein
VPAAFAVQVAVPLTATLVGAQETATEVTVAAAAPTATVPKPEIAGVWVEVAMMVALPAVGAVAGAV